MVELLPVIETNLIELQISRITPCTTSDVFFTNSFLSFLNARFSCVSTPKLCYVKTAKGYISEVLSFTSSSQLFHTIGEDSLPLPFEHDHIRFCLSHLEPLHNPKPRPSTPYPFETHEEHFLRFQNISDSLSSRIPLFKPHEKFGHGSANNILTSITSGVCGDENNPLSYFHCHADPPFYLFISPFPDQWQNFLLSILPSPDYVLKNISPVDLTLYSPSFIIFDLIPRIQFDLPSLSSNGKKLASSGWISILPFSSSKLVLFIHSPIHLNTFYKYLSHDSVLPMTSIIIGLFESSHESICSRPPSIQDDPPMDLDCLPPIFDPFSVSYAPILLICYRILC